MVFIGADKHLPLVVSNQQLQKKSRQQNCTKKQNNIPSVFLFWKTFYKYKNYIILIINDKVFRFGKLLFFTEKDCCKIWSIQKTSVALHRFLFIKGSLLQNQPF